MNIRFDLVLDHVKKKTVSIPYFLFIRIVSSDEFETILPQDLKERCSSLKKLFFKNNQFFSDEYSDEYAKNPYIRFLTGRDIHTFLCKVMSLNYQACQHFLKDEAGSFSEYFSDLNLFWNKKQTEEIKQIDETLLRDVLFCHACVHIQFSRVNERLTLRDKIDVFAKQELALKEAEIKKLKHDLSKSKKQIKALRSKQIDLEENLVQAEEKNIVLVPSDPYYMLGLQPGHDGGVDGRAKTLMKILHPDKSGSVETAYLFDMVLKARDMIIK